MTAEYRTIKKSKWELFDCEGQIPKSDIYMLIFQIAGTFRSSFSESGQRRQLNDPQCKSECWAEWIEQHETAAVGYIRWILAFISSRLSCSLLRFTCCWWLHAHLMLVFISRADLLPPFLFTLFICPPSLVCPFITSTSPSVPLYLTDIFWLISLLFLTPPPLIYSNSTYIFLSLHLVQDSSLTFFTTVSGLSWNSLWTSQSKCKPSWN